MSIYNRPIEYDFIPHYRGDGLKPMSLRVRLEGEPLDLSAAKAKMQLRDSKTNRVRYEFSSEKEGEAKLTLSSDGLIKFPEIKSWEIEANHYNQDLEITLEDGFVITFIKGVWKVNQDITQDE